MFANELIPVYLGFNATLPLCAMNDESQRRQLTQATTQSDEPSTLQPPWILARAVKWMSVLDIYSRQMRGGVGSKHGDIHIAGLNNFVWGATRGHGMRGSQPSAEQARGCYRLQIRGIIELQDDRHGAASDSPHGAGIIKVLTT